MKQSCAVAVAMVVTALSAFSAQAGCVNPGFVGGPVSRPTPNLVLKPAVGAAATDSEDVTQRIIGTWLVTYTAGGSPSGQAYIQWHSDGTEWENINFPIDGGNICLGSWKRVNSKTVSRNHWGWLYTNGNLSGSFNETETDVVSHGGTYTGVNDTKVYDLNGNLQTEFPGTSSATLISP